MFYLCNLKVKNLPKRKKKSRKSNVKLIEIGKNIKWAKLKFQFQVYLNFEEIFFWFKTAWLLIILDVNRSS